MSEFYPLLIVGGVIGALSLIFLIAYFSIKDKKGHYLSYDKQWSRIEASGYDVDYGRINNRHYVVIRKP